MVRQNGGHTVFAEPNFILLFLTLILPGKLTENIFSFTAMTWGIVTGERRGMNENSAREVCLCILRGIPKCQNTVVQLTILK